MSLNLYERIAVVIEYCTSNVYPEWHECWEGIDKVKALYQKYRCTERTFQEASIRAKSEWIREELEAENKRLREEVEHWKKFGLETDKLRAQAWRRLEWLHDCSTGTTDPAGYEWGIYRVKWENGKAVSVWQTRSDFSDLDAEMERELQAYCDKLDAQAALAGKGAS